MKRSLAVAALVGLLVSGCGDDGSGDDPFRNVVSDKRAPEITVTVRDDNGQPVADIAYSSPASHIPTRATTVYLQTQDENTWSTSHSLSTNPLNDDGDKVVEGAVTEVADDAAVGPGPDIYPLPDLNPDTTYRICVSFIVGHPRTDATGCSTPFHSS